MSNGLIVDPGWERRIVAFRTYAGEWHTPEGVRFERTKSRAVARADVLDANAYTWDMVVRRYEYGRDVPDWLRMHIEGEMSARRAA